MKTLTTEQSDLIEKIIDQQGLSATLEAISLVCYEKADHIRANRQDDSLAQKWFRAGNVVNSSMCDIDSLRIAQ